MMEGMNFIAWESRSIVIENSLDSCQIYMFLVIYVR